MLRTLIIENEPDAQILLTTILEEYCEDIESIVSATSVKEGINQIKISNPHLIFLDIQLGIENGFKILSTFNQPEIKIIFTSSFHEYALKAFEHQAIDFLLKPFSPKKVITGVSRVMKIIQKQELYAKLSQIKPLISQQRNRKIALPTSDGIVLINIDQIIKLRADRSYCEIFLLNGQTKVISKPLKTIQALLPPSQFARPHSSHLVNLNFVNKLSYKDGGLLVMDDNSQVPVSRNKKSDVINIINSQNNFIPQKMQSGIV